MPDEETIERARKDEREGKAAPSTHLATNKAPGKARSRKGHRRSSQKAFSSTLPRNKTRAQTRKPALSVE